MNKTAMLSMMALLCGCSNTVTLEQAELALTKQQLAPLIEQSKHKLHYMVADRHYLYITVEIEEPHTFIELLISNQQLLAVSEITKNQHYAQDYRKCTRFPVNIGAKHCLEIFHAKVLKRHNHQLHETLNKAEGSADPAEGQMVSHVVFGVLLSPILIPAMVLQAPIYAYDYTSTNQTRQTFSLTLGINAVVPEFLQNLDPNQVSRDGEQGSAYVAAGLFSQPVMGFGFEGNQVFWIYENPSWECGGGFLFWGYSCRF
jgi:hypothetical protein